MKCSNCNKEIQKTFLNKIIGTVKKDNGKKKYFCNVCQRIADKE